MKKIFVVTFRSWVHVVLSLFHRHQPFGFCLTLTISPKVNNGLAWGAISVVIRDRGVESIGTCCMLSESIVFDVVCDGDAFFHANRSRYVIVKRWSWPRWEFAKIRFTDVCLTRNIRKNRKRIRSSWDEHMLYNTYRSTRFRTEMAGGRRISDPLLHLYHNLCVFTHT